MTQAEIEFDNKINSYYDGMASCLVCRGEDQLVPIAHPMVSDKERAEDKRLKDQNPIDHLSFPDVMICPECCGHSQPETSEALFEIIDGKIILNSKLK